jgi:hypothetical protein
VVLSETGAFSSTPRPLVRGPFGPCRGQVTDQIQRDLDTFMAFYNFRRTHQGYCFEGRTPAKALYDLIGRTVAPTAHVRPEVLGA